MGIVRGSCSGGGGGGDFQCYLQNGSREGFGGEYYLKTFCDTFETKCQSKLKTFIMGICPSKMTPKDDNHQYRLSNITFFTFCRSA